MCLWLLTACLGMLPASPPATVIVINGGAVPTPIITPTTKPTPHGTTTAAPSTTAQSPPTAPSRPPINTATPPATSAATAPPQPPPSPPSGGVTLPVILCLNPDIVCLSNPDDDTTGAPMIDPRLGITPAASGAYAQVQVPQITGYAAQISSSDSSVRFPRQRRSLNSKEFESIKNFIMNIESEDGGHRIRKRQNQPCSCVPVGSCPNTGAYAGAGFIDLRIVNPGGGGGSVQCPFGQVLCCAATQPQQVVACGTVQQVPTVAVAPAAGQANFGEFPWQALILTRQNDYIGGGVLINQQNVLTVTHRIASYIVSGGAPNVKVRLGEWDAAAMYEPVSYQEYHVSRAVPHPSYNQLTLQYDVTVLRLSSAVPLTPAPGAAPTINRACLPPSSTSSYVGQRCLVSGWGKDMFGVQGRYQQILKKVDVPIVPPATCQAQLQAARLGSSYILDTTSFICAGGETNKDACTGDGGSGLVCNVNGQWVVAGLVSWGLGCANPNVPAAYVNIAAMLPWIQQQVATP